MSSQRVVYTAIMGGYEVLQEQPAAASSGIPFVCFTDDPDVRSDTWDVRVVEPILPLDPVRSARSIKIAGHPDLDGFVETLWIDNSVQLTGEPGDLLDEWLDGADMALPQHSYRRDVITESQEVLLAGLDDPGRVYEQLAHYSTLMPEALTDPVLWTAILARRRTPAIDAAMRVWWTHVLRYSRRDQLSVGAALRTVGVDPRVVPLDNRDSAFHHWPVSTGRPTRPSRLSVADSLQPPVARVGQLQHDIEELTLGFTEAVRRREEELARLRPLAEQLRATHSSLSWRLTAPLRRVRGRMGRR